MMTNMVLAVEQCMHGVRHVVEYVAHRVEGEYTGCKVDVRLQQCEKTCKAHLIYQLDLAFLYLRYLSIVSLYVF